MDCLLRFLPRLMLALALLLTPTLGFAASESVPGNPPPCHSEQTQAQAHPSQHTVLANHGCTHAAGCASACCVFLCLSAPALPGITVGNDLPAPAAKPQTVLALSADIFEPPRAA